MLRRGQALSLLPLRSLRSKEQYFPAYELTYMLNASKRKQPSSY